MAGRKKGTPKTGGRLIGTRNKSTRDFKVLLDEKMDSGEVVDWLLKMSKGNTPNAFSACKWLLERRWGKPTERIEIDMDIEEKYNLLSQASAIVMESKV